jgi:hypothetical protein
MNRGNRAVGGFRLNSNSCRRSPEIKQKNVNAERKVGPTTPNPNPADGTNEVVKQTGISKTWKRVGRGTGPIKALRLAPASRTERRHPLLSRQLSPFRLFPCHHRLIITHQHKNDSHLQSRGVDVRILKVQPAHVQMAR